MKICFFYVILSHFLVDIAPALGTRIFQITTSNHRPTIQTRYATTGRC